MNHSILNNRLHHLTVRRGTHEPLNVALDTHCSLPWITQPDGEPVLDALRARLVRLLHGLAEDPPPPRIPSRLDSKATGGGGKLQNTPPHIYRLANQRSGIYKSAYMRY